MGFTYQNRRNMILDPPTSADRSLKLSSSILVQPDLIWDPAAHTLTYNSTYLPYNYP